MATMSQGRVTTKAWQVRDHKYRDEQNAKARANRFRRHVLPNLTGGRSGPLAKRGPVENALHDEVRLREFLAKQAEVEAVTDEPTFEIEEHDPAVESIEEFLTKD